MALTDNRRRTVFLPPDGAWAPWPACPITLNPGGVMYVMDPAPAKVGMFDLPPDVAGHTMINTATVVAVGADRLVRRGSCPPVRMDLRVGERVLVLAWEGLRYRVRRFGSWVGRDVRLVGGIASNLPLQAVAGRPIVGSQPQYDFEAWHVPILASIMNGNFARMHGDWILIRRDPLVDKQSGFFLAENTRGANMLGSWEATIVMASARAQENGYRAGMRTIYHAPATQVFLDGMHGVCGLPGAIEDYAIIRWYECHGCWLAEDVDPSKVEEDEAFDEWVSRVTPLVGA